MRELNSKAVLSDYEKNFSSSRKQGKDSLKFWLNSIYISMLSIIALLIFYYVWILNVNATKGYQIRDLEDIQQQLILEEELLDVKIAELESLTTILKNDAIEDMEPVTDPDHLVIKSGVQYVYNN